TPEIIENAMSYEEYRQLIDDLLEEGKTTGEKQSEGRTRYTRMNVQRMNRLDKTTELSETLLETLDDLDSEWIWLVLTEGWCGDAAQNVPVIHKIAEASPDITLRFILRDEHPEIMDEYLTDGTRSIPKLIALEADTLEEIGTWGPRPESAQNLVQEWKENYSKKEWAEKLHKWYAENKTRDIQSEFESLIEEWNESQ
ncbi:MAG: thioredoxin family protein, partial [Balneolaceae bacterium]|nr:thioredoxin family protein [Balneolaceae bacterium]